MSTMYIKEEVTLVWKVVDLGKDVGKSTIFADVLNGRPQGYITIGSTLHDITSPFVFYKKFCKSQKSTCDLQLY